VEKINLPFFYLLGFQLKSLASFTVEASKRLEILIAGLVVEPTIISLLKTFPTLTVCRATAEELLKLIESGRQWIRETPIDKFREENPQADFRFSRIVDKAKEFETVLSAELQTLDTYHVTQKGIYSTTGLIEEAERILPEPVLRKIDPATIEELRQSGRCLAFDVATASAFHMMRATELVIHKYYLHICKPKSKNNLANWGAYIAKLTQSQVPEVKEIVAMLQQIKDRHRNLIMHPDIVLSTDEAFTLFEIAQGAIIAMADMLPAPKKK